MLHRIGIKQVVAVEPVLTESTCVDNDKGATGIALAHQSVWRRVATFGRRSLVLEADFSIGNQTEEEVTSRVRQAFERKEDYTSLGYCGASDCAERYDSSGTWRNVCAGDKYVVGQGNPGGLQ